MKTRFLTAGILIPLALAGMYFGGLFLLVLVMIAAAITLVEISVMTQVKSILQLTLGICVTEGIILSTQFPELVAIWHSPIVGVVIGVGVALLTLEVILRKVWLSKPFLILRFSLLVGTGYAFYVLTRGMDGGLFKLLFTCGLIWTTDTMALFGGKWLGKHPLSSEISPNKTMEGAAFGLLSAVGISAVFAVMTHAPVWPFLLRGALVGTVGQIGDLHESLVKRKCGVKDSSALLPGHGGFYDRQDSTMFILPVLFYSWTL